MPTQHFEPNSKLVLPITARSGSTIATLRLADPASWAVQPFDPKLAGRTVIVTKGPQVLGANTLARKAGVRILEPSEKARGLRPEASFVSCEPATACSIISMKNTRRPCKHHGNRSELSCPAITRSGPAERLPQYQNSPHAVLALTQLRSP